MAYKELTIKKAFTMLFEVVGFGVYKFKGIDVAARGGDSFSLTLRLMQTGVVENDEEIARQLGQIHQNIRQECFRFFATNGTLIIPHVNIIPPIAE